MEPTGKTDLDGRYSRVLDTAAQFGRLEAVELLLDHPLLQADVHANCSGHTPILSAADPYFTKENPKGKEAVINMLLDRGARASDVLSCVQEYYIDPITRQPIKKEPPARTVLSMAAEWAGVDLIRRLIDNGADPHLKLREDTDFTLRTDITLVSTTSRCASVEALKILLDCESKVGDVADIVSYRDSWGSIALHWACQVLLEQDPREVSETVMEDNVQRIITTIGLLLDCNPETINAQDMYGNTPLHYAAKHYGDYGQKYSSIFKYLYDRGADSSLLNKKRETALHELCRSDGGLPIDTTAIQVLLDHGAKVTDTGNDGNTPLHLAVKNLENLDAIAFLLDHGADAGAKNLKQNTPLHEAANGMFWPGVVEEKLKAMGDILRRLQGDGGYLMDERNAEGKSARQIQDEVRMGLREKLDDIEREARSWQRHWQWEREREMMYQLE
ncbi:hypothetical protein IL306_013496 [Fusarium sp. DS 682]|nr:hypothetical protein IL306_013496 [Fusarium sp. DS 682]